MEYETKTTDKEHLKMLIKEIRKIKDMGLMEAKNFVEGAPQEIKGDIEKEEAEKIKAEIETAGGIVEIK